MATMKSYILTVFFVMTCIIHVVHVEGQTTEAPSVTTAAATTVGDEPPATTVAGGDDDATQDSVTDSPDSGGDQPTDAPMDDNTASSEDASASSDLESGSESPTEAPDAEGTTAEPGDDSATDGNVGDATEAAGDGDDVTQAGGTAEPEDMTTAEPMDGNTTTSITCFECSGVDCYKKQDDMASTCVSDKGICYLSIDSMNLNNTARGCFSSFQNMTKCTDEYPSGAHADGMCGFCCSTDKCNNAALAIQQCLDIGDSGAQTCHNVHIYVTGSVLLLVTYFVQSLAL